MEIILGMLLGALLGGTTIYFLVKAKNKPEQQNLTSNSSRNLILKLIQSLPDIVIWVDGDLDGFIEAGIKWRKGRE